MDTRLKNRRSITILIMILSILLPSLGMIGLYPFFDQQVREENEDLQIDEEFLYNMARGSYVLYVEYLQQQEEGTASLMDIFYPKAKEVEDLTESDSNLYEAAGYMRDDLYAAYGGWSNRFMEVRDFMDYQMVDDQGNTLLYSQEDMDMQGWMSETDHYVFSLKVTYDAGGNALVAAGKGEKSQSAASTVLQYIRTAPVQSYEEYDFEDYTSEYADSWAFQNPQNCTIYYGMTEQQYEVYFDYTGYWYSNVYENYTSLYPVAYIFMVIVALISLLVPIIPGFSMGDKKLFQLPAEVVLFVFFTVFGLYLAEIMEILGEMAGDQQVFRALQSLGFPALLAEAGSFLWHLLCWSVLFAVIYWTVGCLREVFTMGIVRYWKERTLVYKIYGWAKDILIRLYASITNFDFRDNKNKFLLKVVGVNFVAVTILCMLWAAGIVICILYSIGLFFLLRKYLNEIEGKYNKLLESTSAMADGNLDVNVNENLGVFEPMKEELQKVQKGFKKAVQEEVKSQKMKTDLISNVSHDLKTPLTAIITYVNLLKDENITEDQRKEYVDILDKKSLRLKVLIEDLFEVSKATSNNAVLHFADVDIVELLKQVRYEMADKLDESGLDFRWKLPEEKIMVSLDSQKTYRVFENLLINIIKYSLPHTRAYVQMETVGNQVVVTMKNISAGELEFDPEDITERFVRGDASRNTEGSGLGLAIAKSFTQLQNGQLKVEIDADLFTVKLSWPYIRKRSLAEQYVDMV